MFGKIVSILVIVDIARKVIRYKIRSQGDTVSILVIVDIARKATIHFNPAVILYCFNPCYCGYSSKSELIATQKQATRSFNPCYCGYSSKSGGQSGTTWRNDCFNPCYCGYSSKSGLALWLDASDLGFNPCYCGYSSKRMGTPNRVYLTKEFQSLLLWI